MPAVSSSSSSSSQSQASSLVCPIALEPPLCAVCTPCGHVFDFAHIVYHLRLGASSSSSSSSSAPNSAISVGAKCPLCYKYVNPSELRLCHIETSSKLSCEVGRTCDFILLRRPRNGPRQAILQIPPSDDTNTPTTPCHASGFPYAVSDTLPRCLPHARYTVLREGTEHLPINAAAASLVAQAANYRLEARKGDPSAAMMEFACYDALAVLRRRLQEANDDDDEGRGETQAAPPNAVSHDVVAIANAARIAQAHHAAFPSLTASSYRPPKPSQTAPDSTATTSANTAPALFEMEETATTTSTATMPPPPTTPIRDDDDDNMMYLYVAEGSGEMPCMLHPINMRILCKHYGGRYSSLPPRLSGLPVLELETHKTSAEIRRKYKMCGHVPTGAEFRLAEVDVASCVSTESLAPFKDELRRRADARRRREKAKKKEKERDRREEARIHAARNAPVVLDASTELPPLPSSSSAREEDEEEEASAGGIMIGGSGGSGSGGGGGVWSRVAGLGFASGGETWVPLGGKESPTHAASPPLGAWGRSPPNPDPVETWVPLVGASPPNPDASLSSKKGGKRGGRRGGNTVKITWGATPTSGR
ncbi:RING-type domain-containing protein [Pseudoscourfieldia marina]